MFHLLPLGVLLSVACCFVLHGVLLTKLRRKQYDFITHRWTQLHARAAILGSELSNQACVLKSAEEKLRHSDSLLSNSEKCFYRLFHSTSLPLSLYEIDDGMFLDVNRAFEYEAGYTKSELIGRSLNDFDVRNDSTEADVLAKLRAGNALDRTVFFVTKLNRTELVLRCTDRIHFDGSDCLVLEITPATAQA